MPDIYRPFSPEIETPKEPTEKEKAKSKSKKRILMGMTAAILASHGDRESTPSHSGPMDLVPETAAQVDEHEPVDRKWYRRPPELTATRDRGLTKENRLSDRFGLERIDDDNELQQLIREGKLVRIPDEGVGYYIDPDLGTGRVAGSPRYKNPELLHYASPFVLGFLQREGQHFATRFPGRRFMVTSLVRTVGRQRQLQGGNANATSAGRSSHVREGTALDILIASTNYPREATLTEEEKAWLREHLTALERSKGWIEATEETGTNCFHVYVREDAEEFDPANIAREIETTKPPRATERVEVRNSHTEFRDYTTGPLAGRHLSGLFSAYTGIHGRVPETARINFTRQLERQWTEKVRISSDNRVVRGLITTMLEEYREQEPGYMTINEYLETSQDAIEETRNAIDWEEVARIKRLNPEQVQLLREITNSINSNDLLAYALTELMPSRIGEINLQTMEFLLRNAGIRYVYSIPALADAKTSFGPYQFTEFAWYHAEDDIRGGSVMNMAVRQPQRIDHGSVSRLRGEEHHIAAFLFAIDNIANLISHTSPAQFRTLSSNWRRQKDDLVKFIATSHHGPNASLAIAQRWLDNGARSEYEVSCHGRFRDYAIKTGRNYIAVQEID